MGRSTHSHLHEVGNTLNPSLFYDNYEMDLLGKKVWKGFHDCVGKLGANKDEQDTIVDLVSKC